MLPDIGEMADAPIELQQCLLSRHPVPIELAPQPGDLILQLLYFSALVHNVPPVHTRSPDPRSLPAAAQGMLGNCERGALTAAPTAEPSEPATRADGR